MIQAVNTIAGIMHWYRSFIMLFLLLPLGAAADQRLVIQNMGDRCRLVMIESSTGETILTEAPRGWILDPSFGKGGVAWSQYQDGSWQVHHWRDGSVQVYGADDTEDVLPVVGNTGIAWIQAKGMDITVYTTIGAATAPIRLPGNLVENLVADGDYLHWQSWESGGIASKSYTPNPPRMASSIAFIPETTDITSVPARVIPDATLQGIWHPLFLSPAPSPRTTHALVGTGNQEAMVFGGEVWDMATRKFLKLDHELWSFSLADPKWTLVPVKHSPAPRCHTPLAYSPTDRVLLLYGGAGMTDKMEFLLLADTWIFDISRKDWISLPVEFSPGPMVDHGLVYDEKRNRFLLFFKEQVWSFVYHPDRHDGVWEKLDTGYGPPPRYGGAVVLDASADIVLMFGGALHPKYFNDTWILDLDSLRWQEVLSPRKPTPRVRPAMGYDPLQRRVVLFGGVCGPASSRFSDLWVFDLEEREWKEIEQSVPFPGPRGGFLGFPCFEEGLILFGGRSSFTNHHQDTWILNIHPKK